MSPEEPYRPVEILMVEDNPDDVRLTIEAFKDAKMSNILNVAENGDEALAYLKREGKYADVHRPDLILLDMNLPGKSGGDVLAEIKGNDELRRIPVIVLTTSEAGEDICRAYDLCANCYITKPVDFDQFVKVIKTIQEFWLSIVKLPRRGYHGRSKC